MMKSIHKIAKKQKAEVIVLYTGPIQHKDPSGRADWKEIYWDFSERKRLKKLHKWYGKGAIVRRIKEGNKSNPKENAEYVIIFKPKK